LADGDVVEFRFNVYTSQRDAALPTDRESCGFVIASFL
jgi:hypothetical protein